MANVPRLAIAIVNGADVRNTMPGAERRFAVEQASAVSLAAVVRKWRSHAGLSCCKPSSAVDDVNRKALSTLLGVGLHRLWMANYSELYTTRPVVTCCCSNVFL